MNIRNIIDELEYLADLHGDDTEVRFASQPTWPFEYSITDVIAMTTDIRESRARAEMLDEGMTPEEVNENLDYEEIERDGNVVYLVEGSQLGYLPGDVKDEIGW